MLRTRRHFPQIKRRSTVHSPARQRLVILPRPTLDRRRCRFPVFSSGPRGRGENFPEDLFLQFIIDGRCAADDADGTPGTRGGGFHGGCWRAICFSAQEPFRDDLESGWNYGECTCRFLSICTSGRGVMARPGGAEGGMSGEGEVEGDFVPGEGGVVVPFVVVTSRCVTLSVRSEEH